MQRLDGSVDGAPDVHVTPPSAPPAAPLLLVPAVPVVPVAAAAAAAAGQAAGVVNPIFTSAKSGACRTNDNNKGNAYEELWGESKSNCHNRCLYDSAAQSARGLAGLMGLANHRPR